ncbi:selenide, water dikinase SelD [Maricaulis sp. CAU 1757]
MDDHTRETDTESAPRLTSLAHGGGCGCKLDPAVLRDLLGEAAPLPMPTDLLVDASTRDDAAVWRVNDETALVATTDFFTPIVDDPTEFGRIAATNALSDVYAMGATPIFCLALLGMPVKALAPEVIRAILAGGRSVAQEAGAPIAGGHSIDTAEPIYGLVALGVVHPQRLLTNSGAKAGDVLILGKPLGIGIYSAALKQGRLDEAAYAEMIASTTRLNRPGADLAGMDGVHAVTDVTGFGLLGHLLEMCEGAQLRAKVERDRVPVFETARKLAAAGVRTGASGRNWAAVEAHVREAASISELDRTLLCDPQTSGGLLVSCSAGQADAVISLFETHGHSAAAIGRMDAGEAGISLA